MNSRFACIFSVLALSLGLAVFFLFRAEKDTTFGGEMAASSARRGDRQQPRRSDIRSISDFERVSRAKRPPSLDRLIEQYGLESVEQAQGIFPNYIRFNKGFLNTLDGLFNSKPHAVLVVRYQVAKSFGVELEAEQEDKAIEVYHEYALREEADLKADILNLEKNPEPLLELMLAGDARYHDEITEEDYAALQHKYAKSFGNLFEPAYYKTGGRFWARNAIKDSILRQEMEGIFTPKQLEVYRARSENHDASQNRPVPDGLASMRAMNLKRRELNTFYPRPGSSFNTGSGRGLNLKE